MNGIDENKGSSQHEEDTQPHGFFRKYGAYLLGTAFLLYIALLITGLIAEIYDIESILDWWIWRPPGK